MHHFIFMYIHIKHVIFHHFGKKTFENNHALLQSLCLWVVIYLHAEFSSLSKTVNELNFESLKQQRFSEAAAFSTHYAQPNGLWCAFSHMHAAVIKYLFICAWTHLLLGREQKNNVSATTTVVLIMMPSWKSEPQRRRQTHTRMHLGNAAWVFSISSSTLVDVGRRQQPRARSTATHRNYDLIVTSSPQGLPEYVIIFSSR